MNTRNIIIMLALVAYAWLAEIGASKVSAAVANIAAQPRAICDTDTDCARHCAPSDKSCDGGPQQ